MKPIDYYNQVIGKGFDEDGAYGVQCVDGFKHFCRTVLGYNISKRTICYPTNLAHSIWDNFYSLGLDKYFDKVPSNQMVDGDWTIWSKDSKSCPYSHVAMFRKNNGNGTGLFLGQNQGGRNGAYNQVNISYNGVRGGLRPKIYHNQPAPSTQYVNLPPSIAEWRFYDLGVQPIKANAKGFIKPQKFGGLTYKILGYLDGEATVKIQTQQFGIVKIYISNTVASITNSPQYKNGNY